VLELVSISPVELDADVEPLNGSVLDLDVVKVGIEPLQLRNDGDEDVLFFIVGAPPEEGGADYFPNVD